MIQFASQDTSHSPMAKMAIYAIVFLTGASVMVIELLGTRLVAPFYGASLFVWSSLISVTMIALALGYFIGGMWSDRARRGGLSLIIALAGLLTLLIPWVTRAVLLATDPLGLRWGAFVSALVLFLPSLTFLGMVGPFAIKYSTRRLEGVGSSAGTIYAVSTLGSVLGTLTLGFFLFPMVGSREILIGTGIGLLLLGLLIVLYEKSQGAKVAFIAPTLAVIALGLIASPRIVDARHGYTGGDNYRILSEEESLYGWVRVIDQPKRDLRLLTSDASAIGASSIRTGESMLSYQDIVALIPAMRPQIKRALIIGLGAGHMERVLNERYGIVADSLEIDPAVKSAAQSFFGSKSTGQVIVGDARYEIHHLTGPYDLIIHDCFTGGTEPAHLLTVETLKELKGLLSDQGLLAINFVAFAQGPNGKALASVAKTIDEVMPDQSIFISEPGKDFTDFIFLSGSQPVDIHAAGLSAEQSAWLQERVFTVERAGAVALTDNFNPLEHLQTAKSEHYRNFLVGMFGADLFVR